MPGYAKINQDKVSGRKQGNLRKYKKNEVIPRYAGKSKNIIHMHRKHLS